MLFSWAKCCQFILIYFIASGFKMARSKSILKPFTIGNIIEIVFESMIFISGNCTFHRVSIKSATDLKLYIYFNQSSTLVAPVVSLLWAYWNVWFSNRAIDSLKRAHVRNTQVQVKIVLSFSQLFPDTRKIYRKLCNLGATALSVCVLLRFSEGHWEHVNKEPEKGKAFYIYRQIKNLLTSWVCCRHVY